jgi:riboflavin-specific deaminase-like protein
VRRLLPETTELALEDVYRDLRLPDGGPDAQRAGVTLGMVASVDGAVSVDGRSGGLGGEADGVAFRRLRDACDAILVGAGTVRAEDYGPPRADAARTAGRVAAGVAPAPQLLVVTARADLDPGAKVFRATRDDHVPAPIVVTRELAPAGAVEALREVAEVVTFGRDEVDLAGVLRWCRSRGWRRVLCEGGPALGGALLSAGLLDEVLVTIAPSLVAGEAGRIVTSASGVTPADLELVELHEHGGELLLRYRVTSGRSTGRNGGSRC